MKLIVGLGNPGKEYEKTRHNVGWLALDYWRTKMEWPKFREEKKFSALICSGKIGRHIQFRI